MATWVPADAAGAAVVDMRASAWPFLHLVHPKPIPWSSIITPIAKALDVPIVPYKKWTLQLQQVLEKSSSNGSAVQAAAENPALRLIDFYLAASSRGPVAADEEPFVRTRLETKETVKISKTLAELNMLSERDIEGWLAYWKRKEVL